MQPVLAKSYRSLRKLSEGGMGEVFLALTTNPLRKHIVLKKLKLDPEDPYGRDRFLDEARITCALRHRNIVEVYDAFENGGELYLEMEWIRGRSLRQVVDTLHRQPVPPRIAGAIVHDVCRALDAAYRTEGRDGRPLAVIHRDITPNNVMVSFEGVVKVIDFGLARAASTLSGTAGVERGTPEYLSPERAKEILRYTDPPGESAPDEAREPEPLDGRSDLFCAGLLLHELLTGRSLFGGPPPRGDLTPEERRAWQNEALRRIVRCEEPLEGLPTELEPIVRKALAREREARYATGQEMADALREAVGAVEAAELAGFLRQCFPDGLEKLAALEAAIEAEPLRLVPVPEAPPVPTAPPRAPEPPTQPARSRSWLLALPVLLALVAGVAWWLWPGVQPSARHSTVDVVVADPRNLVGSKVTVIVGVNDTEGRPLPEQQVWLTVVGASGTSKRFQGVSEGTGTARFEFSWLAPEKVTLSVLVNPGPREVPLEGQPVTFTAGLPDAENSSFIEVSKKAPVGEEAVFKVALRDAGNHPTAGWEVTFTVEGGDDARETQVKADERGIAELRYRTKWAGARKVGASVVTENGRRELQPVEVSFEAGPPHERESTLEVRVAPKPSGSEQLPVADGQEPVELEVTARDEYGNPVSGWPVRLEVPETEGYTLEQPAVTDEQGHAKGILRTTRTKPVHVRVLLSEGPRPVELGADVTFAPGAPNSKRSGLLAKPAKVTLSGKNRSVLTATVQDAHGNPIPGLVVRFEARGTGSRVEPREMTSDEEGRASVNLWSTRIGKKSVVATVHRAGRREVLFSLQAEVLFEASAPGADKSTLSANTETAAADGKEAITVTAAVRDANAHPVQGRYVLLSSSDAEGQFDRRLGPTDARGLVTTSLTSTRAKEITFSAVIEPLRPEEQAMPLGDQVTVRFVSSAPDANLSRLTASASTLTAGETSTLRFEVMDAKGRPIPGAKVQWKASDAKARFQQRDLSTDERGLASAILLLTNAGKTRVTVTAELEGRAATKDTDIAVGSGPVDTVSLTTDTSGLLADGRATATLTLLAKDRYGNPVENQEIVAWEGVQPEDGFKPAASTTNAAGVVTATLATSKAGRRSLKAVVGRGDKALSAECALTFEEPPSQVDGDASPEAEKPSTAQTEGAPGQELAPPAPEGTSPDEEESEASTAPVP
ncbi:Ig-like domain-containing protein [Archangium violaceum]|uniref:Ig-like domain-containing protein n=1 Tax=Archangium violaceum TaxID=83451 RepID=UPI001950E677|nr:Ig-like domain-containing protein [Archangium violaceum]QRN93576.1 Ig-like domain-containing protein [Archangium violaceum]